MPLDQELIDRLIFMDDSSISRSIRSKDDLKARLIEISHQDLPRRHHPLWQVRCISLSFGHEIAVFVRVHQSLCDGMGLMSLLVSHLADQAPPSTTTFIRTCNGTMTATNCELIFFQLPLPLCMHEDNLLIPYCLLFTPSLVPFVFPSFPILSDSDTYTRTSRWNPISPVFEERFKVIPCCCCVVCYSSKNTLPVCHVISGAMLCKCQPFLLE